MSDAHLQAAAALPDTLQNYVASATTPEAPRVVPAAQRIVMQLTSHIKAALATRGTSESRSFDIDVIASDDEEQDLATALWALHKSGYSTVVRHPAHGRRVITLSW